MADDILSLSSGFPEATEAAWLREVEKALKGKGPDTLTRRTTDGIAIRALYRETDFTAANDPLGTPGAAPFLRGATAAPDKWLPWDIRQAFTHPCAEQTNAEILRDLERGVSSVELVLDSTGKAGVQVTTLADFETALAGVRADFAGVALSHTGDPGTAASALLGLWASAQENTDRLKLDFNMDPLGALARTGKLSGGPEAAFEHLAAVSGALGNAFPAAGLIRIDACAVHEAGASEAQELGALIASAVDTLRRLDERADIAELASRMSFAIALDANYGIGIAKLRAARRLWAHSLEALGIAPRPMRLQAVTSARMLTKYDPWTNILRITAAAFAGATGGADILTTRAFNEALGQPEELGRRIARNTQIIAMEESQLGRVADPTGGAWFTETLAEDLARAAWAEFQMIEGEGGYAASLLSGAFQKRIATVREARTRDIARRKIPLTGVSEYPSLEEIAAPVAEMDWPAPYSDVSDAGLKHFVKAALPSGTDAAAEPLAPIRLAAEFEALREAAARAPKAPDAFIATLGGLAEFTPRADFARNLLAAGGVAAKEAPVPPKDAAELAAAFRASGCRLAVICSTDKAYETGAAETAARLKEAGAQAVWLAGKAEAPGIDLNIFAGCDVLHALRLAHAELGVGK